MTESESVALPLGDTPLTDDIITDKIYFVNPFYKKFFPKFSFFILLLLQSSLSCVIIIFASIEYLPVAQLDSASDSDSEGRRFKSFRAGQEKTTKFDRFLSFFQLNPSLRTG